MIRTTFPAVPPTSFGPSHRLPNLLLIAAPRAGSTQLARWLSSHGDIQLSAVKEPNFFSAHEYDPARVASAHLNDVDPTRFAQGSQRRPAQFAVFRRPADYAALFQPMTAPWRMEASTSYLACPEAPALIRDTLPGARLIFLTRNPLTRALSHYRLARRTGQTADSLGTVLQAELSGQTPLSERFLLRPSQQDDALARYRAHFQAEQCLFLTFETLISAPEDTLARVARWLGVDPGGFDLSQRAQNAGVAPRFQRLNRALQTSGLKTALRRRLPAPVKACLKPLWFDPSRQIDISTADKLALAEAMRASTSPSSVAPKMEPSP